MSAGCHASPGATKGTAELNAQALGTPVEVPTEVPAAAAPEILPIPATPVPDYARPLRENLELGRFGFALDMADALLEAHPDDPWILADAGYVKATGKRDREEGDALLARALELATDASLRAQIQYYQARQLQIREDFGSAKARAILVNAIADFPLEVAMRNLELVDGAPGDFEPSTDPRVAGVCSQKLANADQSDYWTCMGVDVGTTIWVRMTRVLEDYSEIRVFHEWRIAAPQPLNPEGLRYDWGDGDDPLLDLAVCDGKENLRVHGVFGGEGAVLGVERFTWESQDYILVRCRRDETHMDEGRVVSFPSSLYVRQCSLTTGWCTDRVYTHKALHDGTFEDATIEIRDGRIHETAADGTPRDG